MKLVIKKLTEEQYLHFRNLINENVPQGYNLSTSNSKFVLKKQTEKVIPLTPQVVLQAQSYGCSSRILAIVESNPEFTTLNEFYALRNSIADWPERMTTWMESLIFPQE